VAVIYRFRYPHASGHARELLQKNNYISCHRFISRLKPPSCAACNATSWNGFPKKLQRRANLSPGSSHFPAGCGHLVPIWQFRPAPSGLAIFCALH